MFHTFYSTFLFQPNNQQLNPFSSDITFFPTKPDGDRNPISLLNPFQINFIDKQSAFINFVYHRRRFAERRWLFIPFTKEEYCWNLAALLIVCRCSTHETRRAIKQQKRNLLMIAEADKLIWLKKVEAFNAPLFSLATQKHFYYILHLSPIFAKLIIYKIL